MLARQQSWNVTTFKGYEINGNTFYTVAQDKKSTNQNSGVCIDATDQYGKMERYYDRIEEIWELDYGPDLKVPLFRCQWVKLNGTAVKLDPDYEMITVDLYNLGYIEEPFVLAKDVNQVFYVKDVASKPKNKGKTKNDDIVPKHHIVLPGKRNIVGIEDKTDMSEWFPTLHSEK
jgi:hypothetical protein